MCGTIHVTSTNTMRCLKAVVYMKNIHYVSNVKFILGNCSSRNKASMFGKTCYPLNRGTPDLDIKMNLSFDIILCYHLFHLIKISLHASLATLPLVRINWVTICHFKLLFLLPRKTKWEKKECYEGACLNKISLNPLIKYLYCGHAPPPPSPQPLLILFPNWHF